MEKTTKKISQKNEDKKVEEEVVVEKKKNKSKKKNGIMNIFNKPAPIIIALIILCLVQLYFLFNMNGRIAIYTGELNKEDLQIVNLHIFTNNDMNYFYASPATYLGEDKEIYSFEMGYYVEVGKDGFKPFATRSRELDNASDLKEIVNEMSAWNFFETSIQDYFFSEEVIKNLDDLHFIIKASTTKDSANADVYIDYPIEVNKITK